MEDAAKDQTAYASSDENDHSIGGADIAKLMQSEGPVVACVVLRACSEEDSETALEDLVIQREIDTTPAKNEAEQILGGPITFIGQYDHDGEGIVLMGLRGLVTNSENNGTSLDIETMSISQLREQCKEWGINTETMLEKQDLVKALNNKLPPLNPHKLQPPLHNVKVRGDILMLKVADVDDDSEDEDGQEEEPEEAQQQSDEKDETDNQNDGIETNSPDTKAEVADSKPDAGDFFLPYTKEEYLKFAARTDIVPEPPAQDQETDENDNDEAAEDDDNSENEDGDDGNDEDFVPGEDMDEEMTEDEEKSAMLNIVMSELLRKFRSDNGRGAATREVLEIRASVAEQIGVDVVTYDESMEAAEEAKEEDNGRKRSADGEETGPARKRVKFDENVIDPEEIEGQNDGTGAEEPKTEDQNDAVSAVDEYVARPQGDTTGSNAT